MSGLGLNSFEEIDIKMYRFQGYAHIAFCAVLCAVCSISLQSETGKFQTKPLYFYFSERIALNTLTNFGGI